eukprot:TRINITY_DN3086_c0_g1_i2.p1 TRINITY_DN3086_c0_g1~~TRINITY_DN3086_c0_g1_i2.p1  ORF type:complete len:264 (+),score=108.46 TRINITY_DN3086_c0_g1_i2:48-794(+)
MSIEDRMSEVEADVAEMKGLLDKAVRPKVKDMLTINLRKMETDLINLREQKDQQDSRLKTEGGSGTESAVKPAAKASSTHIIPDSQIKDYSWDQSERFVKLYLTNLPDLGQVNQDAVKTKFTDQSLEIRVENYKGKNLVFSINKTCHKINPEKSYHKVKSDYLLVFICKHNPGSSWSHFTYADKVKSDASKMSAGGGGAADTKGLEDKDDPSAGIMNMMKKLYDEGDDEMKRTIAKAWTEGQQKKMDM